MVEERCEPLGSFTSYRDFVKFVKNISVVNDTAERGVKLIQDFVGISSNEKLRQELMLAISEHRKENTAVQMTKETLNNLK